MELTKEVILKNIDPRTWAKIEKRAAASGKTPEAVASYFLDRSLGPSVRGSVRAT